MLPIHWHAANIISISINFKDPRDVISRDNKYINTEKNVRWKGNEWILYRYYTDHFNWISDRKVLNFELSDPISDQSIFSDWISDRFLFFPIKVIVIISVRYLFNLIFFSVKGYIHIYEILARRFVRKTD